SSVMSFMDPCGHGRCGSKAPVLRLCSVLFHQNLHCVSHESRLHNHDVTDPPLNAKSAGYRRTAIASLDKSQFLIAWNLGEIYRHTGTGRCLPDLKHASQDSSGINDSAHGHDSNHVSVP